jgi:hypothetical protein
MGSLHLIRQEIFMATSNNPLAPDPVTDIDGPGVYPPFQPVEDIDAEHLPGTDSEPDYDEPVEDPNSGELPEDEVPEEDPDDEPLADQP